MKTYIILFVFIASLVQVKAQSIHPIPKGKLFIIGGGNRSPELIRKLIETAELNKQDHIAILPMSGEEPDSSFLYIKSQLELACTNTIANLNFTSDNVNDQTWLDSLTSAKLIFITGGDQTRFMKIVWNTPVYIAIHNAFQNGSTISGTSAGAAVMSKYMITGNQLLGDTTYAATFDKLWEGNIEFNEGLGLLPSAIVDQHFVVRSRYNRLLSALALHPELPCIGIDEATAIIVEGRKITVTGESQVIYMSDPEEMSFTDKGLIKFKKLKLAIFTAGDVFEIK